MQLYGIRKKWKLYRDILVSVACKIKLLFRKMDHNEFIENGERKI